MQEIRRKFESELEIVRNLVKRIEAIQKQLNIEYTSSHISTIEMADNVCGAYHVHSEVGSVGVLTDDTRPLPQLSISVIENGKGTRDFMEREKRTPKANQFYRNSEFLLAKDKIPPAESNKKSKLNGKKRSSKKLKLGFGMATKIFNACVSLLEKLMKHKHGWVFNTPVDAEGLGLHDYCSIIRHPMDLGTVKMRLHKNWYKSPKEFAEDVRLTFHNAMTYNSEGQDVHVMAEQLLKIFEDRWIVIESNYHQEMRLGMEFRDTLPSSNSMRHLPSPVPPLDMRKILRRSESLINPADSKTQPMSVTPSARTPSLKKPQAKDPFKRDMTCNEKKRLSTNLQNLPSEKLDTILQIIKKRNFELLQQDDEIEVDIDNIDTETLWELDRLVSNYRKSMSKNKRKAELAMLKARAEAEHNDQEENRSVCLYTEYGGVLVFNCQVNRGTKVYVILKQMKMFFPLPHPFEGDNRRIIRVSPAAQVALAVIRDLCLVILIVTALQHQDLMQDHHRIDFLFRLNNDRLIFYGMKEGRSNVLSTTTTEEFR
ncbi:Transcription factor GTE4, partial [Cucurbita argyrosperma subsp. argyrosperma]